MVIQVFLLACLNSIAGAVVDEPNEPQRHLLQQPVQPQTKEYQTKLRIEEKKHLSGVSSKKDKQLQKKVQMDLAQNVAALPLTNVKISVRNGEVLLRGMVPSKLEMDLIVDRTKNVSGVTRVVNQMQLQN